MPRIHRLAPDLANQIAAGEVVERPASVVKELVENALDAGARRIGIAVELGGKKLIRVEDDGEGMEPEDARLSVERHATSKIARADDLGAIRTLGFRGEALPSIASVSHFTLRTRPRGAQSGTEIKISAGAIASMREVGAPEGTCIEVADLFYNLPARRKFLKSDTAETTQISRLATQLALGYPEVGFTVTSGGRRLLECPPSSGLRERFFQLFGDRQDLVEVRKEAGGLQIEGYVAALGDQGPTRGAQNVFVNRRIVKDRTIAHAIIEAYSVATIKERSPEVHLFLRIAPDRVDVNVHPTKAEVRFLEQSLVHEVLRRALGDALGQGRAPELQFRLEPIAPAPDEPHPMAIPGVLAGAMVGNRWSSERDPGFAMRDAGSGMRDAGSGMRDAGSGIRDQGFDIRPMIPLGQFRDTFIIAVDDEGVAIIDQHVAHERVLFEQVTERLTSGRLESQRLLTPILLELSPAQREALKEHRATLERFGMEIEEFGGDSVRLSAVPALLEPAHCEAAVRALADDLDGLGSRGVEEALRRIAATMACHAAVKANYPLTLDKMRYILQELRRTAYSSVCPHGRPVVLRLTRREIEKNFQRI
jgi:DNA mismatch repair protein MutL